MIKMEGTYEYEWEPGVPSAGELRRINVIMDLRMALVVAIISAIIAILVSKIIQEAAGLLRGGVTTTYEMMLGRWIYGPESQEEAVNINRQQEEEEETATNINKEIDGPGGLKNQGDTEEGTKVTAVENIKLIGRMQDHHMEMFREAMLQLRQAGRPRDEAIAVELGNLLRDFFVNYATGTIQRLGEVSRLYISETTSANYSNEDRMWLEQMRIGVDTTYIYDLHEIMTELIGIRRDAGLRLELIDNYSAEIGKTAEMLAGIIRKEEEATSQEGGPDDSVALAMRREFRNRTTTELIKHIGDASLNQRVGSEGNQKTAKSKQPERMRPKRPKRTKRMTQALLAMTMCLMMIGNQVESTRREFNVERFGEVPESTPIAFDEEGDIKYYPVIPEKKKTRKGAARPALRYHTLSHLSYNESSKDITGNSTAKREKARPKKGPYTDTYFKAYDCRNLDNPRRRVYDITGVNNCPDAKKDYQEPKRVNVGIVQTRIPMEVQGWRCKRWITKKATYCGHFHHRYGTEIVEHGRLIEVSQLDCKNMVYTGKFDCSARDCYADRSLGEKTIRPDGSEQAFTWVTRGVRGGSRCPDTTGYVYGGRLWGGGDDIGVYEETTVHIIAEPVTGRYDTESGTIVFDSLNMRSSNFTQGGVTDVKRGSVYWNTREYSCTDPMRILFDKVEVELRVPVKSKQVSNDAYKNAMVILEEGGRVGGFKLKERYNGHCLQECFKTQVTDFIICLEEINNSSLANIDVEAEPDPYLRNALKSVSTYNYFKTRLWAESRFDTIINEACKMLRTQWFAALSDADPRKLIKLTRTIDRHDPNSTLSSGEDVGYSITSAGGAVIIEECPAVKVRLTTYKNCTREIPATYEGVQIFVDPVTRVVKDWPRVTICNEAYPVYYPINKGWICATPNYGKCQNNPTRLAPSISIDTGLKVPEVEAYSPDIYSKEIWEASRNRRQWESAEPAIVNLQIERLAQGGQLIPGQALAFTLRPSEVTDAFKAIKDDLFGGWFILGEATVYILAGAIVFLMAREFVGNIARMLYLINKHGCGCWVVRCLLNIVLAIAYLPGNIMKGALNQVRTDITKITDDSDPESLNARVRALQTQQDLRQASMHEEIERQVQEGIARCMGMKGSDSTVHPIALQRRGPTEPEGSWAGPWKTYDQVITDTEKALATVEKSEVNSNEPASDNTGNNNDERDRGLTDSMKQELLRQGAALAGIHRGPARSSIVIADPSSSSFGASAGVRQRTPPHLTVRGRQRTPPRTPPPPPPSLASFMLR